MIKYRNYQWEPVICNISRNMRMTFRFGSYAGFRPQASGFKKIVDVFSSGNIIMQLVAIKLLNKQQKDKDFLLCIAVSLGKHLELGTFCMRL